MGRSEWVLTAGVRQQGPRRAVLHRSLALVVAAGSVVFALPLVSPPLAAQAASPPTVTAVSPETGTTLGGTSVTITGTNFVSNGTTVAFGSVAGTSVSVSSATKLTVVSPAQAAGTVAVAVTTSGGTSTASTASRFEYVSPGAFTALSPTRICDTRAGTGTQCSGSTLAANGSLTVQVGGVGGVPASGASAAFLDVTAIGGTAAGTLTLSPAGLAPSAPATSVAFAAGQTVTGLVEVPLGASGQVVIASTASSATDAALDVEGYVGGVATGVAGLVTTATPLRICDTRSGSGTQCAAKTLSGGGSVTIQVTGQDSIPTTGVAAVVANLTAVNPSLSTSLTAYATGTTEPAVSNVTAAATTTVGNRVIVPVSSSGQITVTNAAGVTDVLLDVSGWIESGATPAGNPSQFVASAATRVCDTRTGSGSVCAGKTIAAASSYAVQVSGVGGVPAASTSLTSVAVLVTEVASTASGTLTVYADGTTRPSTTDVSFMSGHAASGFVALVPLSSSDGKIDIYNSAGSSDVTVDVLGYATLATAPSPPAAVTAVPANTSATVSWTAPAANGSAITGYTVTPYVGSTKGTALPVSAASTSVTVTGLVNGTSYTFQVTATNAVGTSTAGVSAAVTPATVPGAPTSVAATPGNAQASVSWKAPASNGGSSITGYKITPYIGANSQGSTTVGASSTSATITGLTNGTSYTFAVAATNAMGTGAAGTSSAVTPTGPPAAPGNVAAVPGNTQLAVSWTAPSNGGSAITGYTVTPYIGTSKGTAVGAGPSATSLTLTGLTNGTTYTVHVTATNALGTGPAGVSAAATPATVPGAPTNVTATAGNAQATVAWTAPSTNGGSAITSYVVTPYIGTTAQATTTAGGSATSVVVTGLTNGTTYTFTVAALNSVGAGAATTSAAATPTGPPAAPTSVSATAAPGAATVTWVAPPNGGSPITGYTVTPYVGSTKGTPVGAGASATSATATGLVNGTTYTFAVTATSSLGTGPAGVSNAVTPATVPGTPSGVTATAGYQQASVTWTAPSNGGSAITSYLVTPYQGSTAGTPVTVSGTTTAATVTGLTDGLAYTFSVVATNSVGSGVPATSNAITPTVTAPGSPASISTTAGQNQVSVTWLAPSNTGGYPVTGYLVSAFAGSVAKNEQATTSSVNSATISGLQGGTSYTIHVQALNQLGYGQPAISVATTPTGTATTYASTVLGDGPGTYLRLDDSGPVAAATVGSAGTYVGGVTHGQSGALANDGDQSVQLDGSTGYVDAGLANQSWSALTVEVWFLASASGQNGNPRLVANSHTDIDGNGFQLMYNNGGGNGFFDVGTVNGVGSASWNVGLSPGQWYHYVGTYDGSTVKAYLNGVLVGSASATGNVRPSGLDVNIGRNPAYNGDYFNGTIDEVAIYPVALSAAQVSAHYNASGNNTPPPAPTTVTATAGANQAAVTWATVSSATRYSVTAFAAGVATNTMATDATGTGVTMTGLRGGVAYTFQVVAINQHGTSPPGTSAAVTPTGAATTYASTIQADVPAAYYRLDDPSGGVAADSSGHGNMGLYNQNSSYGAGQTPAGSSGALSNDADSATTVHNGWDGFTGGNITDAAGTAMPQGSSARSWEGWFQTSGGGTLAALVGSTFRVRVSGQYQLQVITPGGTLSFTTLYPVTDNSWHLVDATYDGSNSVTVYLDGVSLGTQSGAGSAATASGLSVAGDVGGGDQLLGAVDEVALYGSALTATQVSNHFNASGDSRPSTPTVTATAAQNQVVVSWSGVTAGVPAGASPVSTYLVTAYAGSSARNAVAVGGSIAQVTMTGLQGGVTYTFQVIAGNEFGWGPPGTSAAVTPTGAATTYASTIQADVPAAYYRLDDPSSGLAADSSGHGNMGLYNQNSSYGAGQTPAGATGALATDPDPATSLHDGWDNFTGGDIVDSVNSGMPQGSSPRTWESWFQTTGTGTIAALLGNTFRVRVGGQYQLQVITPGGTLNWTTPYPVTDNSWHLVEAVYDGTGTVTVYLDGVSLGVQSGAGTAGTATGLSVSGDANGVDQLLGAIDEVALYDSVLSGSQVANHFAASGDIRPTAPGAPTNVAATSGDGQATVTWTAPASNGGSAISSYTVTPYVGTSAQTPTSVSGSTTSLTTTAISNGTTYTFQVFATNAIGSGAAATSNAVTPAALPGSPRNVTATAADARAVVNWSTPAAPGNIVSSYTVMPYAGTTAQTTLAVTVTTLYGAGVDTTANVGGLTDGTRYTFQVTATNGTGTGPPGTSAGVTPIGVAPLKLAPGKGYSSASTPVQAVTADITGNGWRDIVTANGAGNNVSALLNQIKGGGHSGGTFAQPATLSAASAAASDIALGDFNGDGKLDMVVVSGTSSVGVMLGNGNGTFGPETVVQTLSNQNANVVAVADMNGDGKLDIVVAGGMIPYPWGTAIDVLLGNGDGTFQAPVQYQIHDVCLGCGFYSTGLALADLNGDGQIDIAYTNNNTSSGSDTGAMYALLNQGGGTFNVTSPYPTGTAIPGLHSSAPNETVAIADINGDGIPDVVTVEDAIYVDLNGSGGQRGISISFGKGDGTFLPPVYVRDPALTNGASPPSEGGDVVGLAMADMNGDGLPDIATADSNSLSGPGGVSVYLNRGGGSIDSPIFIPTGTFSPRGLSLGDMNGDSEPDVVLENNLAVGPNVPANVLVLLNGTDFPPLGGPLAAGEMHGCAMCQAMRGGGAVAVSGANPITVNSGEMSHTFTDLSIPARGYALSITQTYNDLNAGTDAGLGYGWWSPLFMSLTQDSGTGITTVTQENGGQAQFWTSSLQPVAPRTQATLLHNGDGTWTFTRYNSATFSFNSSGKITSMTDLTGDSLSFGYTGSQVTSLTHSDGRSLAIAWTSGHISSITDSNVAGTTRTVSLTYDGSNQLTDIDWKVNGANDRNEHFEYETAPWNHGMTGMRDPRGIWVTQVYDPVGRTTSQTVDPTSKDASGLNRTTTFAYTLSGGAIGLALITDPAGHQEQDTFAYGEMVQKITGYGTSSAATWTYSYDPSSVGTTMTIDPNGGVSSASYDTNGNPLASTDALGRTASSTYTGNGGADGQNNQPTTVTDPNGVTTTNTYDATHRTLTQTSTPLVGSSPAVSQVIQYQHANASHPGDVTVMIDGDGKAWTYGYDAFGNKSSTTDPVENKSSMAYNADGWVLTTITPMGDPSVCTSPCTPSQYTTTYSYVDGSGNTNFWGAATTVTDPLGHHTVKVYDSNNNVTQLTDGNGNVTAYDFDNANEPTVTHRADANHTTVTTDYNADGTVRDQIDGKGNTLQSYTYNSLGQQTAATADPGSSPHVNQTTAYTYDALGNVLTKQAPAGSCTGTVSGCTTYTYDAASQLTGITYSDGATPNVSTIQYDADGQRVGLTDGTGSWSWQYDSLRRLTSVTEGTNGTVAYQYNLRNEPTAITYPGTTGSVTRGYDNAGRWTSVQDWKGAQTTFGYDGNSNLQTQTTPTTGTSVVDTSAFNASDQLTSISSAQGATSVFSASYGRDGNGQVTSDTSATTSQNNYGYSPLNQLCYAGSNTTSACSSPPTGSQSFAYDASGNLTSLGSTTQAFNTADQMTTSGTSTYQYDSSGNRTGLTAGSSVTNYGYNQANRLCWTGPTASGSACNAGAQSSDTVYCYNATGLRMAKVTAGSCASPTTSEAFTWDVSAGLPLLLVDGSAQYVYGPGGLPLEQVNGAATLWYHHDQIGSTRAITDGAGALKATYTYDPYGNVLSCSGTAVTVGGVNVCTGTISVSNPLDFSGQYRDAESGYYYLRARYYDPTTAQFLTLDPWVTTTRSPYAYVAGNPLNGIDPSGLDPAWYERCVNAGICDGSGTDQGDAGKAYASWRVRFQWMAAEHIPRDDVPDPYESPTLGPNEWRSVCGNLWFVEGCVTFTGTGNCYLSGGLGIGVPGVAINGGATHGGTSDDLIGGPSAHAGGHYYGGGGYAQSPNGTGGAYWTIGTPGAGVYGSWGIKVP